MTTRVRAALVGVLLIGVLAACAPMFPAGLKTCVSVVKAVIGVRNAFVLTPRQLYNYVDKRGGIV